MLQCFIQRWHKPRLLCRQLNTLFKNLVIIYLLSLCETFSFIFDNCHWPFEPSLSPRLECRGSQPRRWFWCRVGCFGWWSAAATCPLLLCLQPLPSNFSSQRPSPHIDENDTLYHEYSMNQIRAVVGDPHAVTWVLKLLCRRHGFAAGNKKAEMRANLLAFCNDKKGE